MPRLHPRLLYRARRQDPLLPLVLRGTRDLASAKNELRWLKEFVTEQQEKAQSIHSWSSKQRLRQYCLERARGKPLQYIIGNEYFGDLEIACEPGVLIPRQETAASVTHLVERLHNSEALPKHLKILDLCTGTGCIPLLASYELMRKHGRKSRLQVVGVDISSRALSLADRNLQRLCQIGELDFQPPRTSLHFLQADVLAGDGHKGDTMPLMSALRHYENTSNHSDRKSQWDILISNPPYISPQAFKDTTTRSVKRYEPKLALVPNSLDAKLPPAIDPGDVFYPRLLDIAKQTEAKVVLFEVADFEQASRVAFMAQEQDIWAGIEIWRDDPAHHDLSASSEHTTIPTGVKVLGTGNGRSVLAYRGDAKTWLCDPSSGGL
ncbi:S-adenosyl-L-methionine-dependent methyltransferase [Aureobasidium subglaciale]|nr:S-adenosyl-L-methionine-dependent methyltransferase [Aureobasidium subglaciale]